MAHRFTCPLPAARLGLVLMVMMTATVFSVRAQEAGSDLTELSLEELMKVEVVPIDVLGSHIHLAGEWMLGYRLMHASMDKPGADPSTSAYMVLPTRMVMTMHMVELMYGVTDRLTLMAMAPLNRMTMDHTTRQGVAFTTRSAGLGDVQLSAHYALYNRQRDYVIADVGFYLPTGSINVRDDTPAGADQRLPYPMQLGAGTVGLLTSLTYINQMGDWVWGTHAGGLFRLGKNTYQYRPGHQVEGGTWIARRVTRWFAPMLQVRLHMQGNVAGADPALNPAMVPTADPHQQSKVHVEWQPGLSFYVPRGALRGQRLALQSRWLLYETIQAGHLDPIWQVMVTWRWTF